jgi:hypothetical protein
LVRVKAVVLLLALVADILLSPETLTHE